MISYTLRRVLTMIPLLLGLSILTFAVSHVMPGDPVQLAAGPHATREEIQALAEEYGFDQPLPVQYLRYMRALLRGDWGRSILSRRPVREDLAVYLPATLELVVASMFIAIVLGVPLGIVSAIYRDRWPDNISRILSLTSISLPRFFLSLLLQLSLAMVLGLFPIGGRFPTLQTPPPTVTGFLLIDSLLARDMSAFWSALHHIVLPAFALCLSPLATISRMMRASVIEVTQHPYVLTERALGLPMPLIMLKYVLKNASISTLTVIGLYFGWLLGGSVLIESVFDWPGIGLYATNSIVSLDFQPIMGVTLVIGVVFVVTNLVVDLLYGLLDPRIVYEK